MKIFLSRDLSSQIRASQNESAQVDSESDSTQQERVEGSDASGRRCFRAASISAVQSLWGFSVFTLGLSEIVFEP